MTTSGADAAPVASSLELIGTPEASTTLQVRYEVVRLLSEQLYSSPLKAVEELVVNAWDAQATKCLVYVPEPDELSRDLDKAYVAVLDNGEGMGLDGLADLWHVGRSRKREADWETRHARRQIGKFGIGKLATYALGRQVTFLSRHDGEIRGVTLDFADLSRTPAGNEVVAPIELTILGVKDVDLAGLTPVVAAIKATGTDAAELVTPAWSSWTLVVIERLSVKAQEIRRGRLHWVLQTAMPLATDFELYLNGAPVDSAKEEGVVWLVDFSVAALDPERIKKLSEEADEPWASDGEALRSPSFPSGVRGRIRVADSSLYYGKSGDLGRSHGFFVRVRGRLINEDDPLFGATPLSFSTFYNFHGVVDADDLDGYIKAPRDDVEQGSAKTKLNLLLRALFNQAREAYDGFLLEQAEAEKRKREGTRDYVPARLLERPLADALIDSEHSDRGRWSYVTATTDGEAVKDLIAALYERPQTGRPYKYRTSSFGRTGPLVRFDPAASEFTLNEDHELVIEYWESASSRRLLQLFATAEALLEVYLREFGVRDADIQLLLTRRDELIRSLAQSRLYSITAIARALRDAADDERDLEVALVGAARALGFVARQISGPDEPDGDAKYEAFATGPSFTLEAKSSRVVPTLGTLDFAGLRSHANAHDAEGCLLVAPSYPGGSRRELSQVSRRARQERVSCWTVELLASVVAQAEARQINADQIEGIVLSAFSPQAVRREVRRLLERPAWNRISLRRAVIDAIEKLEGGMRNTPRDVSMILTAIWLSGQPEFSAVDGDDVRGVIVELAAASSGMLYIGDDNQISVRGALDELRRRVASGTNDDTEPRRGSPFVSS